MNHTHERIIRNKKSNLKKQFLFFQAQLVLLVVLLVAIVDFVIGAIVGPLDDEELARGFTGFNSKYKENKRDSFKCVISQGTRDPL